ncbi:MAG: hypothetical protein MN733_04445, partial [Nitrososphaera sp.]|nr:hypothetical protein [Nitrososphaera sp.]
KEAGFDFEIKEVPVSDNIAIMHGLPVLFGLSGKFEGLEGIQTFIENATILGYPRRPWAVA